MDSISADNRNSINKVVLLKNLSKNKPFQYQLSIREFVNQSAGLSLGGKNKTDSKIG